MPSLCDGVWGPKVKALGGNARWMRNWRGIWMSCVREGSDGVPGRTVEPGGGG